MMRNLLLSLMLFAGVVFADATPPLLMTKVVELHYIQANDLIPQLKPLLLPTEVISGSGSSLILRVSPDTLTQLRQVIHQLDVPPVVFSISIHQGSENWLDQQQNEDIVYSTSSDEEGGNTQSVNVMSGESAFISTATERPILTSVSGGGYPYGPYDPYDQQSMPGNTSIPYDQQQGYVSYQPKKDVQGFYVKPLLQGGKVKVTLRRVRQQADRVNDQSSEGQFLTTTTLIPLNKWVKLGDAAQSNTGSQSNSTTYEASNSFTNEATLFIKIGVTRQ